MSSNMYEKHATVPASAASPSSSPTAPAARLGEGSVSRFLSPDYRLPFGPLVGGPTPSFNDLTTWPQDPMHVFSHWYADAEEAYNQHSPVKMDAPVHWPNTMQIATISPSGFPSVRTVLLKGFDSRGLIFFTNYEGCKGSQLLNDPRVAVVFYWKALERQVRMQGRAERLPESESDAYFHNRPIGSQMSGTVSPQSRVITSHTELEEHYVDTVQAVAQQVEALLEGANGDEEQIAATKAKVSELLGSLSAKKNAALAAHKTTVAAGAAPTQPSAEESAKAAAAHQTALESLQRLEASPVTAPLLHACVKRPPFWGGFLIRPTQIEYWCDGAYRLHSRIVYEREGGLEQTEVRGDTKDQPWAKRFLAP